MRRIRNTPPPDAASLHAAALTYLARYAATEAGLARVLRRRIDRWVRGTEGEADATARLAQAARVAVPDIVARLVQSGAVSDPGFAQSRARALAHAGKSRRAIANRLAQGGVPGEVAQAALPRDEGTELAGALIHARKRRMGPWRRAPANPEIARREFGSLARAGFTHDVARAALSMERETAEVRIATFRASL